MQIKKNVYENLVTQFLVGSFIIYIYTIIAIIAMRLQAFVVDCKISITFWSDDLFFIFPQPHCPPFHLFPHYVIQWEGTITALRTCLLQDTSFQLIILYDVMS